MELFKLYLKEEFFFFCFIKLLLRSDSWELLILVLTLILKNKGGKQHCLPFVGSNLGLRYFWKRGNIRKGCLEIKDWSTSTYFLLGFQENYIQSLSAFSLFFGYKREIRKDLFSFIPQISNLSDLPMAQSRGKDIQ